MRRIRSNGDGESEEIKGQDQASSGKAEKKIEAPQTFTFGAVPITHKIVPVR